MSFLLKGLLNKAKEAGSGLLAQAKDSAKTLRDEAAKAGAAAVATVKEKAAAYEQAARGSMDQLAAVAARGSARKGRKRCSVRKVFDAIDRDQSGSISAEEVVQAFKRADRNKSGKITYGEFVSECTKSSAVSRRKRSASSAKKASPKRKRTTAKKASAKKASAKRTTAKKASAKKASAKKASAKKASAKKASAKKASAKKASAKKASAKRTTAKKTSAKKASAKKASAPRISPSPKKAPAVKKTKSGVTRPSARAMYDAGAKVGDRVVYSDGTVKYLALRGAKKQPYFRD